MRIAYLAALLLFLGSVLAEAQVAPKDGSYLCVVEVSAGLRYNERTKKWESATFRPTTKFTMRMKSLRSITRKDFIGNDQPVHVFDVTTTKAGSSKELPCEKPGEPIEPVVIGGDDVGFDCLGADLQEYRFNLKTDRFLTAYMGGYVDGANSNADTPYINGGTCTKID